jgi:hypothetical protein
MRSRMAATIMVVDDAGATECGSGTLPQCLCAPLVPLWSAGACSAGRGRWRPAS